MSRLLSRGWGMVLGATLIAAPIAGEALADPPLVEREAPAKKQPPVKKQGIPPELKVQRAAVEKFVRAHTQHVAQRNLEAYLKDFIPNHPQRHLLKKIAKQLFASYDFEIEIENYRLVELSRHTARVHIIQRTRRSPRVDDVEAAHERAEIKYVLRKVNKAWKVASTVRTRLDDPQGDD